MRSLFDCYEGDSFLHRRNPALKLASVFVVVVALAMAFDPWTPLVFLVLGLAALRLLGGVPLRATLKPLALLAALGALGFVGANAFFYRPADERPLTVLWQAGALRVSAEGLRIGVALTLRMLAIVVFSLLFVTTTPPTALVLSLVQNARLPVRLGFGILVAYRFLPLWRTELGIIRAAHRIRGVAARPGLRGAWAELRRYAVPLLAGAIRQAERVAISMEAKSLGALPERTWRRRLRVTRADWALLLGTTLLVAALLLALARSGLLAGYGVVPRVASRVAPQLGADTVRRGRFSQRPAAPAQRPRAATPSSVRVAVVGSMIEVSTVETARPPMMTSAME